MKIRVPKRQKKILWRTVSDYKKIVGWAKKPIINSTLNYRRDYYSAFFEYIISPT